ncbi:hypothetical protein BDV19DRAFT_380344 [Aspergillus venezuelensis]
MGGYYDPTACAIAAICFLVATCVFTAVRLFVRIHYRKGPFLDDTLAIVALLFFTVYCPIFIYSQLKGYVPLALEPTPAYGREGLKLFFICDMFYSFGSYTIKLSFTYTLLQLTQTRAQYIVLFITMTTGAIITVATCIHAALFCKPASYHWDRFRSPDAQGHCAVFWSRMVATFFQTVWVMIADFVLGLVVPFMILRGARMQRRTKRGVRILLGLGALASITTIIRLVYLGISSNPQLTYAIVPMAFWSLIEHGLSILCVAITTWKPLFVAIGLVDACDNHNPVRLANTADEEVFGGSTFNGSWSASGSHSAGSRAQSDNGSGESRVAVVRERETSEGSEVMELSSGSSRP